MVIGDGSLVRPGLYTRGGGGVTERSVSTRSNRGQIVDKGRLKEKVIARDGDSKGG